MSFERHPEATAAIVLARLRPAAHHGLRIRGGRAGAVDGYQPRETINSMPGQSRRSSTTAPEARPLEANARRTITGLVPGAPTRSP